MPTGYTADIDDKTTFPQFAMRCARAFGALVSMRESDQDAVIPAKLTVDDYYPESVAKAEKRLGDLREMSEADADAEAQREYDAEKKRRGASRAKDAVLLANYQRMLAAAKAWTPPTPGHAGLRTFMIEQLESSIRGDCQSDAVLERWEPQLVRLDGTTWRGLRMGDAERALESAREYLATEASRIAQRNGWLSALRESLASQQDARLICAAPEMLALLVEFRDRAFEDTGLDWDNRCRALLASIGETAP